MAIKVYSIFECAHYGMILGRQPLEVQLYDLDSGWAGCVYLGTQGFIYWTPPDGRFRTEEELNDHCLQFIANEGNKMWRHIFPRIETSDIWSQWNVAVPPPWYEP